MKNLTFNFLLYVYCSRQLMWSDGVIDKLCPLHWGDLKTHQTYQASTLTHTLSIDVIR